MIKKASPASTWALPFWSLLSLFAVATAQGQETEYDINIAVVESQMAYDTTEFTVSPGSTVNIHFTNNDAMTHNLIVASATGGEEIYMKIANLALQLGAEAYEKEFVPETDLVLAHSSMLEPGETETITFTAPEELGPYPYVCTFPGHASMMNGIMNVTADGKPPVGDGPESAFTELRYRYFEGRWSELPDFDAMTPVSEGELPEALITLDPRQRGDDFGFSFEGKLRVETPGAHIFMMRSDDGSKFYLDGELLIDHDGLHGEGEVKTAAVDLDVGLYEVRVDYFERSVGEFLQVDWLGPTEERLPIMSDRGRMQDVRQFIVEIEDEPQVWRVLLPGSNASALAVGLPEHISFCFDPTVAAVQYAWQGDFINRAGMVGHGEGRGPESVAILGERFGVGAVERPLRIGDPSREPEINFLGYSTAGGKIAIMYEVDGNKVTQTVEAPPNGSTALRHHFKFAKQPTQPVHFLIDRAGLQLTSSAGTWHGNRLTVPAGDAREFSVTVINPAS